MAGYLLSLDQNMVAPQIYCCATAIDELEQCLDNSGFKFGDNFILPPVKVSLSRPAICTPTKMCSSCSMILLSAVVLPTTH